ncbi:helix-turn-helix domain-containing protein [Enterococcus sp. AZ109]|uniref:helix-turn-helix domain-containing protein n=1 Tax=Enterococcus sp. AZ109 TaxID=2774634 RepID=UPI003F24D36F
MSEEKNIDAKIVGSRIRQIRQNLGYSMAEFATKIDEKAKSGTVSNWETGKNLPNNRRLKRIAELGNVSIFYLLEGKLTSTDMEKAPKGTIFELYQMFEGSDNEIRENVINYSLDFLENYNDYDELETWSINNLYRILNTLRTIENEKLSKNTKDFILVLLQNLNFEIENNPNISLDDFFKSTLEMTNYPS